MRKRLLALLLSVVIVILSVPVTVTAGDDVECIEVRTVEDLYNIRNDLTANYKLMNDIDLTEATAPGGDYDYLGNGWDPIGSNGVYDGNAFSGIFDGNGRNITGMRIEVSSSRFPNGTKSSRYFGLFSNVSGIIKDLKIYADISYTNTNEINNNNSYIGTISGYSSDSGKIINCMCSSSIISNTDCDGYGGKNCNSYVGGIVGVAVKITISNCSYSGVITASVNDGDGVSCCGGIVGRTTGGTVSNCINLAEISAIADGYKRDYYAYYSHSTAGGICGELYSGSITTIKQCYNVGTIKATGEKADNKSYSAGIAPGSSCNTTECYNVGVVSGINLKKGIGEGTISNSYYLSGCGDTHAGSIELSAAQMLLQSMYAGFDFENTWIMDTNAVYPYPQLRSNPQDLSEAVELVRILALPEKLEYVEGEELDTTDGLFEVVYVTGRTEMYELSSEYITGFDTNTVGTQTLTLTFGGKTDTFEVTVIEAPEAVSMTLSSAPDKTTYVIGTELDLSGAEITVEYEDGSSKTFDVTAEMVSGQNMNHIGRQTLTVSYLGFTDTFEIEVVGLKVVSINVSQLPDKVEYIEGEEFDPTGLVVTAVYNDGRERSATSGFTLSGYDSTPGVKTITVKYLGKETTFTVTVNNGLPVHTHTPAEAVRENRIEPTCTEDGSYDNVVYCSDCGAEISRETIILAASGHSFTNEIVILKYLKSAADCTRAAEYYKSCSRCGAASAADTFTVGEPLGHDFTETAVNEAYLKSAADCTHAAVYYMSCSRCGAASGTETFFFDKPLGHNYQGVVTEPSCEAGGYTTYTCSRCGAYYIGNATMPLGHDFEEEFTVDIEPTETEPGQKSRHCRRCDAITDVTPIFIGIGGMCGDDLTWTLDEEGTLTISGTGEMYNYTETYNSNYGYISTAPWGQLYQSIKSISIGENVTSVGSYAFYGCSALETIFVTNSVTFIGDSALYGCTALTDIYFTNGGVDITRLRIGNNNDALFQARIHNNFSAITSGTCGDNLTWTLYNDGTLMISGTGEMYRYSYTYNTNYGYITTAPWGPYYQSIKAVNIGENVTSIGSYAFYGCSSIARVAIGNDVTSIGSMAFYKCSSLLNITIPDSVTCIVSDAFDRCSSLESITVSDGNSVYHSGGNCIIDTELKLLVAGCKNSVIPSDGSVTLIGSHSFYGRNSLMEIIIPNGVTSIRDDAFYGCTSLSRISIPNSVTSIGYETFANCTSLTSIDLGSGVTYIDGSAFYGCLLLTNIYIPDGVTSIGSSAFYGCSSLTSIDIPDNVSSIENWTFYYCSSLISVVIPDGVTSIKSGAFDMCSSLKAVAIPDSLTFIEQSAFRTCDALTDIYYSGSDVDWNEISIENENDSLLNATIYFNYVSEPYVLYSGPCGDYLTWTFNNQGVLTIFGNGQMYDGAPWESYCDMIRSVVIEDGVTSIGGSAFAYCHNLTSIIISKDLKSIGDHAFYDCISLTSINIPYGVESIGEWAFGYCENMISIFIPDSVTSIGNEVFNGCFELKSVTIPNGVAQIGDKTFYYCTALRSIVIPESVTLIGVDAFFKCSLLKEVYYIGSEYEWDDIEIGEGNEALTDNVIFDARCLAYGHRFAEGERFCLNGCGELNPDYKYKVYCDGELIGEWKAGETVILPTLPLMHDNGVAYRFFSWNGSNVIRSKVSTSNDTPNGRIYTLTMPESSVMLTSEYEYIGDVNGDGKVNTKDLIELKKVLSGYVIPDDKESERADIDCNGKNGSSDLGALKRLIVDNYVIKK